MSWAIGFDKKWQRDIGYGVPAICDYPGCGHRIDRGLAEVCGGMPYGGDHGCGLYFCEHHLAYSGRVTFQRCERCKTGQPPFDPTPDHPEWVEFKLTDPSWEPWRKENPITVEAMKAKLKRGDASP